VENYLQVLLSKSIDVSVAVALDTGLITPIIKNTNTKGLATIGAEMKDLAARARLNKYDTRTRRQNSHTNVPIAGCSFMNSKVVPSVCPI